MLAPTGGLLNNIGQDARARLRSLPLPRLDARRDDLDHRRRCLAVDAAVRPPAVRSPADPADRGLREAAQVDGAGVWPTFWKITFPLILPTIATVLVLKLILSFKVFDLVFIMTSGGPGFDTTVSSYSIYRTALQTFDVGAAAAQTIAFLVLVTIIIVPLNAVRQRLQQGELRSCLRRFGATPPRSSPRPGRSSCRGAPARPRTVCPTAPRAPVSPPASSPP